MADRPYKSFVGEQETDSFLLNLPTNVRNELETKCREEWREHHKIHTSPQGVGTQEPFDKWIRSFEGRFHSMMLDAWFLAEPTFLAKGGVSLPVEQLNAARSRLMAQGRGIRGTRRQYNEVMWNFAAYKRYRNWRVTKALATMLGAEFDEPPPLTGINALYINEDNYILAAERFEQWTELQLPAAAWRMTEDMQRHLDEQKQIAA